MTLSDRWRVPRFALVLAALFALVHVFVARQSGFLSIQGQINRRFAARASLMAALEGYRNVRPPLYPILLWIASRAGIRPARLGELLLDAALLLLLAQASRALRKSQPMAPVALFAVLTPNFTNLYQTTAEILFVPLLLLLLLLLDRHRRSRASADLWPCAAVVGALGLTRYFGLFFATPILAVETLRFSTGSWRTRLLRAAGLLVLAVAPIAGWMAVTHAQTGYWTGADRTQPRRLPEQLRHWSELSGFQPTVALLGKTLFIDFFSPDVHASLAVVTRAHAPAPVEYGAAGLAALAAGLAVAAALRPRAKVQDETQDDEASSAGLTAELFGAYLAVTVALWTLGNNDPLYTRFLWPSYPLLVLLGFHGYALAKPFGWTWRLPFWAAAATLVTIHVTRDWVAAPVPFR